MDLIKNSFLEAQQVLEAFISDEKNLGQIKNAGDLLVDMFRQGGKCLVVAMEGPCVMPCILPKNSRDVSVMSGLPCRPLQLPILPISPVYRTI